MSPRDIERTSITSQQDSILDGQFEAKNGKKIIEQEQSIDGEVHLGNPSLFGQSLVLVLA